MTDPSMVSMSGEQLIKKALIIVPVNTIMNWDYEFDFWLREEESRAMLVYNLNALEKHTKDLTITRWSERGGVLLVSEMAFRLLDNEQLMNPDVIILDEAHQMLKNATTKMSKKLLEVNTQRKIGTFSPRSLELNGLWCVSHQFFASLFIQQH